MDKDLPFFNDSQIDWDAKDIILHRIINLVRASPGYTIGMTVFVLYIMLTFWFLQR